MNADKRRYLLPVICGLASLSAYAEVTAKDAWVRATVPAQKTTAAYVTFVSTERGRVVEVKTPVAGHAEFHRTTMEKGVMRMEAVPHLPLPPNYSVELKPGGYHIMLMEVSKPLTAGQRVPLTFVIEDPKGKRTSIEVSAEVRPPGQ
jgi:copper(I)-binding protein